MNSLKTNKYAVTDRNGMLKILRGLYSFEKSHSILQIVNEDGFWEDDNILIIKGFPDLDIFGYSMKCV